MSVVFSSTLNLPVLGRIPPWCSASDDPVNCTDDTADEIMERIVRSATQGPSQRSQPRERRRSRANRKSCESYQLLDTIYYQAQRNAISCMCRHCNDTLFFVSAQWGGHWRTVWQQRRQTLSGCPVVQRCRCELDIRTSGSPFTAPPMPNLATCSTLSWPWNLSPASMSWPHLYAFGSHRLDTSASRREWIKCFIHKLTVIKSRKRALHSNH